MKQEHIHLNRSIFWLQNITGGLYNITTLNFHGVTMF